MFKSINDHHRFTLVDSVVDNYIILEVPTGILQVNTGHHFSNDIDEPGCFGVVDCNIHSHL